ncbi:hypothetical protein SGLAM104S_08709 [Streptomyces glaucescens]
MPRDRIVEAWAEGDDQALDEAISDATADPGSEWPCRTDTATPRGTSSTTHPHPCRWTGGSARVVLGTLAGDTSPVRTFTPLLGAELSVEPGAALTLDVDPDFEHGLLVDTGDVRLNGTALKPAELGYAAPGHEVLTLANEGTGTARLVLLGGPPFGEEIVMWWNFIGRTHDDIVRAREDWQDASDRFGRVEGYPGDRLPAPALPNATLTPRGNPARAAKP